MNIKNYFNIISFLLLCFQLNAQSLHRFEFTHQQMGTQFHLILYSDNKNKAQIIANQCFNKVDDLNQIFSDYKENSEVNHIARSAGQGKKVKVSSDLWKLLKVSRWYYKRSKGAFDITMGPLTKLWRSMIRRSEIFDGVKISAAKAKTGFSKIKFFPISKRVKLTQKGMRLDLGGIAKGYTVDKMAEIIKSNGIQHFLVDGGGDLYLGDALPNESGWAVQINLRNSKGEKFNQQLILQNTAIASSGDTYRFLEQDGKRYSHIIDPRTGYGVINQDIINIEANSCMHADVIASILSIFNEAEGQKFLKKIKKGKKW